MILNLILPGLIKMQAKLKQVDCIVEVHDARVSFHLGVFLFKGKKRKTGSTRYKPCSRWRSSSDTSAF